MKILLISHVLDDYNAGASRVYHLLASEFRAAGHQVDLVHLNDFGLPANPALNLLVRRICLPVWIGRKLRRRMDLSAYDVVMSSSGHGYDVFRRLDKARTLAVNHLHGLNLYDDLAARQEAYLGFSPASLLFRFVTSPIQIKWDELGRRHGDITVVQNKRDQSYLEVKAKAAADLYRIPPPVEPQLLQASETISPLEGRAPGAILWFGAWEPRKSVSQVPAAFRRIREAHPSAVLTLGGTGWKPGDLELEFDPQDRSNIRVLPRISVEEHIAALNEASIFLFPSLSEGFGLALAEAMCFGCVAVTTSTGFGGDYLTDRRDSRVVYPSARHLADAVVETIGDEPARLAMANAGRTLARGLTPTKTAQTYLALFGRRLPERRPG